jgi:hypothetical protein
MKRLKSYKRSAIQSFQFVGNRGNGAAEMAEAVVLDVTVMEEPEVGVLHGFPGRRSHANRDRFAPSETMRVNAGPFR